MKLITKCFNSFWKLPIPPPMTLVSAYQGKKNSLSDSNRNNRLYSPESHQGAPENQIPHPTRPSKQDCTFIEQGRKIYVLMLWLT